MAANKKRQRGQSLIEFAFLIPIFVGMMKLLLEVNGAISVAIVNQKYARSAMTHFSFNHRYYPELFFLRGESGAYFRRYWIGVDDRISQSNTDKVTPRAPERTIGNLPAPQDGEPGLEFPELTARQKIRIRVTSFTCIPPVSLNPSQLSSEEGLDDSSFVGGRYQYCED